METMESYLGRKYRVVSLPAREDYDHCSMARVAAIVRNTRRMARVISKALGHTRCVALFQHGLYLTLSPAADLDIDEVRELAGSLSSELEKMGLPVRHAGSFGFDFVAIEWFQGSSSPKNLIRIAASDLPPLLSDRIAERIASWWSTRGMSSPPRLPRSAGAVLLSPDTARGSTTFELESAVAVITLPSHVPWKRCAASHCLDRGGQAPHLVF